MTMPILPQDRLIVALDLPTVAQAQALVTALGSTVTFYKIGLELLMSGNYFALLDWLKSQEKKVFVDLKFFDVPQTVASAVQNLAQYDVDYATIHGNDAMMQAAAAVKGRTKILAVTLLTSLDQGDVNDLGFAVDIEQVVLSRAKRALSSGCDGVISSGLEVIALRQHVDSKLIVVCPGIRPLSNTDDQKRTVDVAQAFRNGADHIVVGRPIRQPLSGTPTQAAAAIQSTIAQHFNV